MKKHEIYVYGVIWMTILVLIGRFADDILYLLIWYSNLTGNPQIRIYLLATAMLLLTASFLLLIGAKSQQFNRKIILRILIASVLGGFGVVWLLMVFIVYDL